MPNKELSTICYLSNIYTLKSKCPTEDKTFMSMIHEPNALKKAKESFLSDNEAYDKLSNIQMREYKDVVHCAYSDDGEYPFGRLGRTSNKIVCKCNKVDCKYFISCRNDYPCYDTDTIVRQEPIGCHYEKIVVRNSEDNEIVKVEDKGKGNPISGVVKNNTSLDNEKVIDIVDSKSEVSVDNEVKTESDNIWENFIDVHQKEIIEASVEDRTLVNAGPGTGKTYTVIKKIVYMLQNEGLKPEEIMVLCYTRAAVAIVKEYLEKMIDDMEISIDDLDMLDIRSFDSAATLLLLQYMQDEPDEFPQSFKLDNCSYDGRIAFATNLVKKYPYVMGNTKHLVVDEVQDLVGYRAEFVLSLLLALPKDSGFTVLGDSCQSLYDYQALQDKSIIPSYQFYQSLLEQFQTLNCLAMKENHRHGDKLVGFSDGYRTAILSKKIDNCTNEIEKLRDNLIGQIDFNDIFDSKFDEKTAILTRTNAIAMSISQQLREKKIKHVLKIRNDNTSYGDWIANVFFDYSDTTIDRDTFIRMFLELYKEFDEETAIKYWHALIDGQKDRTQSRYNVSDLLQSVVLYGKDRLLFASIDDINVGNIIVSNVHQSKGCEFEYVIVDENLFNPYIFNDQGLREADKQKALLDEYKVCYVALTRAKKQLSSVKISDQYIRRDRIYNRRYKSKPSKFKRILERIEIKDDFNTLSFAETIERQKFLRNSIKSGDNLKIIRYNANEEGHLYYKLVKSNDFGTETMLAKVNSQFVVELRSIMGEIKGVKAENVYPTLFPTAFKSLHVGKKISLIANAAGAPAGAKTFGNVSVWTGLCVVGFAKSLMGTK